MTDHQPARQPGLLDTRLSPRLRDDTLTRNSYETGESSTTGSLRNLTPSTDRHRESTDTPPSAERWQDGTNGDATSSGRRARRKHRHASSSAFLLQDGVPKVREGGQRLQSRMLHAQSKPAPKTSDKRVHTPAHSDHARGSTDRSSRQSSAIPSSLGDRMPEKTLDGQAETEGDETPSPDRPPTPSVLDVDSSQIVHMALNLSESRRIASRRNVSRTNPPRLAQLPDTTASGNNLRQHFQQQRRTSRTGSPNPNQAQSPRIPSGIRSSSPLASAFDAGHDSSYQYLFTPSTLARAHKAREQLELMAEYRRLLDVVPPLVPDATITKPPAGAQAIRFGSKKDTGRLGRQYNPLQYIRNRKVRARERKVIDGDQQGFGDADAVRSWVDQLEHQASLASLPDGTKQFSMPRFPSAHEIEEHDSPESASKAAARIRRPRVDWFWEPCDMIADAYWLEQGNHKNLIEDRDLHKIFAPKPETRPATRATDESPDPVSPFSSRIVADVDGDSELDGAHLSNADAGLSLQSSAKEKAKQKLQEMKGFHHRHNSLAHNHDILRIRRGSLSDTSDSDGDFRDDRTRERRGRSGTISGNTNDLLEKQMLEMLAKEEKEKERHKEELAEDQDHPYAEDVRTPERSSSSRAQSRYNSRKGSMAEASDSDVKLTRSGWASPVQHRAGRASLEIPDRHRRYSTENDSSLPNSPLLKSSKGPLPLGALEFSPPPSRPGSPSKLSKVKQRIRDRGREVAINPRVEELEGPFGRRASVADPMPAVPTPGSPEKRRPSPPRKVVSQPSADSYRTHRSQGSIRMRDDPGVGLRGMFKGPRIDTVLKGSVSKLGDMLWKKDASNDSLAADQDSTDESESDAVRGRGRLPLSRRTSKHGNHSRRTSRHFFDTMPQFQHVSDTHLRASVRQEHDHILGAAPNLSRPLTNQSSRFELLKPPRIDVRSASPSISPPPATGQTRGVHSEASDSESYQASVPDGVRSADRRLSAALSLASFDNASRPPKRHWSIADRGPVMDQTQLSKREVARMRALILSSGIKAMEIGRRANELYQLPGTTSSEFAPGGKVLGITWPDIAKLSPDSSELFRQQHAACELYPLAARNLSLAVQASGQRWQSSVDHFARKTSPALQKRVSAVRSRVADDLSQMTRDAADRADETSRDLAQGQPLKVKHVVDLIEKMLRRRRRRFRWLRRGLWLAVEWVVVGFMWYVWFVVMIMRVFLAVGKGAWGGVKWLLWL